MRDLPLFSVPPDDNAREIDKACEQDVALLTPIAVELLNRAEAKGASGITANDVRTIAEARGLLLASTQQRYLARVGRAVMLAAGFVPVGRAVMLAAGFVPVGRAKTPRVGRRGGNDVVLWGRRRVA